MRTLFFIITISVGQILACNGKTEAEARDPGVVETDSDPEPPPPSFSCSNSITLQEWFSKLCDTEKPGAAIIAYRFVLFETENCYAICLTGSKDHEKKDQVREAKNDYEQSIKYYPLSKTEYKDLKWNQTLNKIKSQLKEFINTEEFNNSHLARAKAITISFDDGDLLRIK